MASYASEFSYPNFMQYSHTLGSGDYEMTGTYGEPLPSFLEEFGFSYPGPVSSPNGGVVYQTSRPSNEYTPWLGIESYFDRYWGEGLFPHGSGFETFNNPYGDELVEKVQDSYLGEEHHGSSYNSYDHNVEMQPGSDYNCWCADEYGNDEDFHDYGNTDGVDTGYRYGWDEKKLCESIFGYWPCLSEQNHENYED